MKINKINSSINLDGISMNLFSNQVIQDMKKFYIDFNLNCQKVANELKKKYEERQKQYKKLFNYKQVNSRIRRIWWKRLSLFFKVGQQINDWSCFLNKEKQQSILRHIIYCSRSMDIQSIRYILHFQQNKKNEQKMNIVLNDLLKAYGKCLKQKIEQQNENSKEIQPRRKAKKPLNKIKVSEQQASNLNQNQDQLKKYLPFSNFKCSHRKQNGQLICCNSLCEKPFFICNNYQCKCKTVTHKECLFMSISALKQSLSNKAQSFWTKNHNQIMSQMIKQVDQYQQKINTIIQKILQAQNPQNQTTQVQKQFINLVKSSNQPKNNNQNKKEATKIESSLISQLKDIILQKDHQNMQKNTYHEQFRNQCTKLINIWNNDLKSLAIGEISQNRDLQQGKQNSSINGINDNEVNYVKMQQERGQQKSR